MWATEMGNVTPHLGLPGGYGLTWLLAAALESPTCPATPDTTQAANDYGEATWTSGNTGSQTYGASPHGIPTEVITDAAPLVRPPARESRWRPRPMESPKLTSP